MLNIYPSTVVCLITRGHSLKENWLSISEQLWVTTSWEGSSPLSMLEFCLVWAGLSHAVTNMVRSNSFFFFFDVGSLTEPRAHWLSRLVDVCLPVSAPWTQCTAFYMGAEYPNTDFHAYGASTLLVGAPPYSYKRVFKFVFIHMRARNEKDYFNHNHTWWEIQHHFLPIYH